MARFVVETAEVPQAVLHGARIAIADALACGLAGTLDEGSAIARRWVAESGGKPQATVWGSTLRATPADAALANGMFVHALDFDDTLPTQRGHPSSTLVPAVLAVAEATGASGREALGAYVLGLEVAGVVGRALGNGHYLRGWHPTSTAGVFAATAAAARLYRLDAGQLCSAWGIAASQASGHTRNFGTMTKPFHAGLAARGAVMSTWLARQGFTGDADIFGGRKSFLATYAGDDGRPFASLVEELGSRWALVDPGINYKRWPCCSCNHRPIGGLLEMLAEHRIATDEVEAVSVGFPPGSDDALKYDDPRTGAEGKFSIQYSIAATLLDRRITLETYTDAMLARPEARQLMQKVRRYRIPDDKVYSGTVGYNDLELVTRRGTFRRRVDRSPGSSEWPMSEADHEEKFLDCASRVLGAEGARRLLQLAGRTDGLPRAAALAEATVPAGSEPLP
ncbi:MAG: MmgE/PrpD family protein [bacterium]|nr:MmgE/PrpD family protein [Betaproteobacteria bacterium]